MKTILAVLAAVSAFSVLAQPDNQRKGERMRPDPMLIAAAPMQWLQTYSLAPYKEYWTLNVEVQRLDKAVPKLLKIYEKAGASLTQPLKNFPASETARTQQLSYTLSLKAAKAALKEVRKVGTCRDPLVRPNVEPVPLAEVKDKIRRLSAEKETHAKELAAMPAVSALVDELLGHLLMVQAVREKTDGEVLLNMTVQGRR